MKQHDIEELYHVMYEGLKNYDTSKRTYFVCCKNDEIGHIIEDRKYILFFNSILIRKNLLKLAVKRINDVQFTDHIHEYEQVSMGKLWSGFRKAHDEEIRELSRIMLRNQF